MTEPIKLPPLPEPDWYLVMSADGDNVNVELRVSDEEAVNAALDMGGIVEIHRLITIDKAEAYATAAIEADRQARGEPVATVNRKGNLAGNLVWTDAGRSANLPDGTMLYTAPQPHQQASEPVAWLRNERGGYEGKAVFDPLVILGSAPPTKTENGATYSPVFGGPQPQQHAGGLIEEAIKRITDFIERRKQIRGLDQAEIMALDGCEYALLTEDLLAVCAAATQPQQHSGAPINNKEVCGEQNVIHAPQKQYYCKDNNCTAKNVDSPDCICWHDEGCGPLSAEEQKAAGRTWRDKPQPQQQASEPPPHKTYVQEVPDHCDRIVWRGSYYHLPIAPQPQQIPEGYKVASIDPPANCRQRLAKEGNPYPRSSCFVCGQLSPRHRECDAMLEAAPGPKEKL